MVFLHTLRAGYRLALHGLSTEILHALLRRARRQKEKEASDGR